MQRARIRKWNITRISAQRIFRAAFLAGADGIKPLHLNAGVKAGTAQALLAQSVDEARKVYGALTLAD